MNTFSNDRDRYGLCFSLFDERAGPLNIYHSQTLSSADAEKVVVRTMLLGGSFLPQTEEIWRESKKEAILFLKEVRKSAFFYLFNLPPKNPQEFRAAKIIGAFSLLTEPENQTLMYRDAPALSKALDELFEALKPQIQASCKTPDFRKADFSSIQKFLLDYIPPNVGETLKSDFYTSDSKSTQPAEGEVSYLLRHIDRNLDQVVFSLITNKQVVVLGGKTVGSLEMKLAIDSLALFCPHRNLDICYWTEEPDFKDIVGTTLENKIKYLVKGYTIIDLEQGRIYGGKSNTYCQYLLRELEKTSLKKANILIRSKIRSLLTAADTLTDILTSGKDETEIGEQVADFTQTFDHGMLTLIAAIIEETNPDLSRDILFRRFERKFFKGLFRRTF